MDNIDSFIENAEKKATEQRYYANFEKGSIRSRCLKYAEENEQLIELLEELKSYRKIGTVKELTTVTHRIIEGYKAGVKDCANILEVVRDNVIDRQDFNDGNGPIDYGTICNLIDQMQTLLTNIDGYWVDITESIDVQPCGTNNSNKHQTYKLGDMLFVASEIIAYEIETTISNGNKTSKEYIRVQTSCCDAGEYYIFDADKCIIKSCYVVYEARVIGIDTCTTPNTYKYHIENNISNDGRHHTVQVISDDDVLFKLNE